MNSIDINLENKFVLKAIDKYLDELIERTQNQNRYTKFDSINDIFLGYLGELAFAKHLYMNGFQKNSDYFQIANNLSNPMCFDAVKDVNGKIYDQYDFKLHLTDGNPLKIDVKTQKYAYKFKGYTEDWQFAINSNTIDKINQEPNRIDKFLFIFSQKGLEDFIGKELAYSLPKANYQELIKIKEDIKNGKININKSDIIMEMLGFVNSNIVTALSTKFNKGEAFRLNYNQQQDEYNVYKVHSDMYRIDLRYLSNVSKIIPPKVINNPNISTLKVKNMADTIKKSSPANSENFHFFINGENTSIPYDRLYLNSQHDSFETMLLTNCSAINNGIKNNSQSPQGNKMRNNYKGNRR